MPHFNVSIKLIVILQLSLPDPPVSPLTTIFPLTFVVVVSMIKQASRELSPQSTIGHIAYSKSIDNFIGLGNCKKSDD